MCVCVGVCDSISGEIDLCDAPSIRNQEARGSRWCLLQLFDVEAYVSRRWPLASASVLHIWRRMTFFEVVRTRGPLTL